MLIFFELIVGRESKLKCSQLPVIDHALLQNIESYFRNCKSKLVL